MNYKRSAQSRIKLARFARLERLADKYDKRIKHIKELVKKDDIYRKKCEEYGDDVDFIDDVNISFGPIDVSAKTINGEIILNERLYNEDIIKQVFYALHELNHVQQQSHNLVHGKTDKADYLDDENEQEAFGTQISYMCEHMTAEEVQDYIEHLLDHHDINGEERKEKAKKIVDEMVDTDEDE